MRLATTVIAALAATLLNPVEGSFLIKKKSPPWNSKRLRKEAVNYADVHEPAKDSRDELEKYYLRGKHKETTEEPVKLLSYRNLDGTPVKKT
ncbi:hypothetical protein Pmar_PMAR024274 [Perkinsus marinus ATCC 50983]|uniref:Uncharacterized protein n=1 Tax=Perkinsus marinus (strain ATCC 50983 / TXsc) TaxID=423536 RepID=C5L9B0_PERM5|nr:hypothetical protein Pmar_PMAR024274 [Perkinsus marinus ATCC 50983]EER06681.1 hypothetical protein Pmar_PMAR024274 [Perkinsus marinus ATCC 50983]|eukprot:XP_002774865.1 hypothetical protein Pmar_PMAR024274 [Perkinsus marinus ATCC 50983]